MFNVKDTKYNRLMGTEYPKKPYEYMTRAIAEKSAAQWNFADYHDNINHTPNRFIVVIGRCYPLQQCEPKSGYFKSRGVWRFNSSNIHSRINRRVGLCT